MAEYAAGQFGTPVTFELSVLNVDKAAFRHDISSTKLRANG